MTQITNILSIIALLMAVLALVGVGIVIRNIEAEEIDYHGADGLGLTCNDDEEEK